jgi:osmoprotectant transport system permease protein
MKRFSEILFILILLNSIVLGQKIRIGAKNFNEGYLLSEILAQLYEENGFSVERKFNLGGTLICFTALKNNEIDIYPEYTGTISEQILKSERLLNITQLREYIFSAFKLQISQPYGFNNTYALAMKKDRAKQFKIVNISDLARYPQLKLAFSYEFLKRKDGWENLAKVYNLKQISVGIEHGLAYQALDDKKVDIIDAYSTDGEIPRYNLKILEDDLHFFPTYYAVSFYNSELGETAKGIANCLANKINGTMMQSINSQVVFKNKSYVDVARSFLIQNRLINSPSTKNETNHFKEIVSKTITHLKITFIALFAAIIIAIPLGIVIYNYKIISKSVLYLTGLLQTIPSIALLAIMIPLFGIGVVPAIVALFLYALLPILRNTATALFSIDPQLKKVATGIGLTKGQRLRHVEVPLAMPTIFAGIKTAAVINIGTATLAAFIGAGGLGEFIVTGLALNNTTLILKGAIPAALLAILIEFIFELIERIFIPKHLLETLNK